MILVNPFWIQFKQNWIVPYFVFCVRYYFWTPKLFRFNNQQFGNQLKNIVNMISKQNTKFYLFGDYNIDLLKRNKDTTLMSMLMIY